MKSETFSSASGTRFASWSRVFTYSLKRFDPSCFVASARSSAILASSTSAGGACEGVSAAGGVDTAAGGGGTSVGSAGGGIVASAPIWGVLTGATGGATGERADTVSDATCAAAACCEEKRGDEGTGGG